MRALAFLSLLILAVFGILAGCGGGGGSSTGLPTSLAIVGNSDLVAPNGQLVLSVVKRGGDGGTAVWSVVEAGGGTVTSDGRYTAPATPGVYTVRVALQENAGISATKRIDVGAGSFATGLTVSPTTATVGAGGTRTFTATKTGGTEGTVLWSVAETGGGTISTAGLYTAPEAAGTYTVRATLRENAAVAATATVTVTGRTITITSPTDVRVLTPSPTATGSAGVRPVTLQFTASTTGGGTVQWTASGGTIGLDGLYTAPSTPGTYTVTARNSDDAAVVATRDVIVAANAKVRLRVRYRPGGVTTGDRVEGDIVLQLDTAAAPNTAGNLVTLVNQSFYDGIIFHRYEPNFVIQGGDPRTKTLPLDDPSVGSGGPGWTIDFETNPLLHDKYALGMARATERNTGGSQWYLCLEQLDALNGNYVVFGRAIEGFSIVDSLRRGDTIVSARTEAP